MSEPTIAARMTERMRRLSWREEQLERISIRSKYVCLVFGVRVCIYFSAGFSGGKDCLLHVAQLLKYQV